MEHAPPASEPGPRSSDSSRVTLETGAARAPSGAPPEGNPQRISIVAPLWNENPNVLPLTQRVLEAFREEPRFLELILIDDASTDGTWEKMLEARNLDNRVRALRQSQHAGQSAALWAGFAAARGEVIGTLDGDLQNDPADLPRLLARLAHCDLVCGVRLRRQDNTMRRISTRIARWARRAVLGVDFRDTGCNLRMFKGSVVPMLLPFDGLHRFMPILAHDAGAVVEEMPVAHHPRTAGRSKYGVWNRMGRGIMDLAMVAWYRRRRLKSLATMEAGVHSPFSSPRP
jgi:dolichol-phosphate mannosyltransferase